MCTCIESANHVRYYMRMCAHAVFWKCCFYWSGLSVTNEPSGTATGMRANNIMCVCVWVVYPCPHVVHQFVCARVCVFVCFSDILCGQWGWGGCKPVIALASVVLQLIYWTARQGGGWGGGESRRGLVLSGNSTQQSKTHSLPLCTPPASLFYKGSMIPGS